MKSASLILFIFFCYSCASGQKDSKAEAESDVFDDAPEQYDYMSQLEREIIGEWTNVSMRVWVKTFNNSDTSFIVDISEENWEMKMNVKPIITAIYEDGTYVSEFRNSFDSLVYRPEGTWLIDGDTLIMQDHQAIYKYQIFIDGDRAEFNSLVDWDKDGKADDVYFGIQRKNY
ncbi:MAG: hypothetical protein MI975_19270 [Cytophagales bacterium]|nr:hypothetical protein [Cytophagales bacterium]